MRLALLATAALAVLATWPLVVDPLGAPLGHPGNDVWNHVWGYWWVAQELGAGRLPLHTDLMHFPSSGRLFFIDVFGALATLPAQWIAGPVAAYNAAIFGASWTSGLGAWALARHVLARTGAPADRTALIAAAVLQVSPHLLAQAYNGITETLFAGGLPLATLAVLRVFERPTTPRALVAAGAMALCTLANWYYGLFAAIGSTVLLGCFAFTRRERVHWSRLPSALALASGATIAAVLPMLAGFVASLEGDDALVRRDPDFVWRSLVNHNITDLVSAFRPGRTYSPDLAVLHGEDLLIVTYVGWTLLAAAGLGVARLRRWRDRVPWIAWVGLFGLLMLGPYLYVGGAYVTVLDRRIPLPFLALFDAIPFFQRISHPFRFVVPVQLGLAVLAVLGVAAMRPWVRVAVAAGVIVECLVASPAVWPTPRSDGHVPEHVRLLRDDDVAGAVLDLPIAVPNLERAVYLYWQTGHGRPSLYTLNEPLPRTLAESHLARLLLVAESSRLDRVGPLLPTLDLVASGRALAELGVRWVVVHDGLYLEERLEQTLDLLRTAFGPETAAEAGRHLWRLGR